jgi:[1-hydroxy-2-(trimethylamino)ethyl]phosphonate dioxygenase
MTIAGLHASMGSVDELIAVLDELDRRPDPRGADVVGAVPHLLQTAEHLQRVVPDDEGLVVAGLVHDLASTVEPGCADHGTAGAEMVESLLGARVARLVAGHTDAKRYLVTVEPDYADGLSQNSSFTLIGQGGSMSPAERDHFVRHAEFDALILLRRADDAAKVPGAVVRPVSAWRPLLERVAAAT